MNTIIIIFDSVSIVLFILSIIFVFKYRKQTALGKHYIPFEKKTINFIYESNLVLIPFNCGNCGAPINFNKSRTHCSSCNTKFQMPKEYQSILEHRITHNDQLLRIQMFFKQFSFFTSIPFKIGIIILLVITVFFFFVLFSGSRNVNFETDYLFESKLVDGMIISFTFLFVCSLYLSLIILIGKVFESFTNEIPQIFKNREFVVDETLNCKTCGAEIIFTESNVSRNCMYCGVENYRSKFAKQLELILNRLSIENANSLIDLEHSYKSRMYELLVVPSVVYSTFIFLPIVLFFGIKVASYF